MALNPRQIAFVAELKSIAGTMENLYGRCHALSESFDEEFDDAQDHSFLVSNADLLLQYYMESTDVKTALNQTIDDFIKFWTNQAVQTRDHGKDLRRVK